jgi:hypothetical protein
MGTPADGLEKVKDEPQPRKKSRTEVLSKAALTAMVVAFFYYAFTFGRDVSAKVECAPIEGGYNCKVSLLTGSPTLLGACWEMKKVCANGVQALHRRCFKGSVIKESPGQALVANSEFENHQQCDRVTAITVENVELSVSNGIFQSGKFQ